MNDRELLEKTLARLPEWGRYPIMLGYRGSHAHGTYIPSEDPNSVDDIDVFAITVQPPDFYFGLDGLTMKKKSVFNTAGEEIDIELFDLRKFVFLLNKGNPNVHQWLWVDNDLLLNASPAGELLRSRREGFMSRKMFDSFGGYAVQQLKRMTKWEEGPSKEGYMGKKRYELAKERGYDTKNAAHCIRLLYCGILLALENRLVIKLPDPMLSTVIDIKTGKWPLQEVMSLAEDLDKQFRTAAADNTTLPSDYEALREWSNETIRQVLIKDLCPSVVFDNVQATT